LLAEVLLCQIDQLKAACPFSAQFTPFCFALNYSYLKRRLGSLVRPSKKLRVKQESLADVRAD
jgi:hypothetical protein